MAARKLKMVILLISLIIITIMFYLSGVVFIRIRVENITLNIKHSDNTSEIKSRRLPNYIIIGVKKCGTRALIEYINKHPKVAAAKDEIHFFDDPVKYEKLGLEGYRQLMPESYADQITIEKSPRYYSYPNAADRIYDMSKDTRIIIVVREPITRLLGDYMHECRNKNSNNLTCETFNELITTKNGSIDVNSIIVAKSRYVDCIDEWIKKFSLNQIHVVDGERLVTDPYSEMVLVENFLSLKQYFTRDNFEFSTNKGFYCFKQANVSRHNCPGSSKGLPHPPIDKRIVNIFTKYYEPYNEAFFKKVKRNFNWKLALEKINTN